ncbi:MAG: uL15 family ribosomal protein [Clostridia bacterium]|nr:uL15 family ribosomal protein [Clostridia bacterium]
MTAEPEMSIDVAEADEIISDEYVEAFVRQSEKYSDKTKKAVVNIDTLGKYFNAGERVTVEEIKKRVPEIGGKVTYIKVLARGKLDKALTVEADDFSPQAIKMIVLTGGSVERKAKK